MVGLEPSEEEKIETVVNMIKEKGDDGISMPYKQLQDLCADKFEGVRLLLKKMKSKGIVDFDGMIPGFSAMIELQE